MSPIIAQHQQQLADICRWFRVARLEVFGSAVSGDFDARCSDLDFVVEFGDLVAAERFHAFFALQRALTDLFGRPVDLVEAGAPCNPYFIRRLSESRKVVYAA